MNSPDSVVQELIAFDGSVDCEALSGAVRLRLRGARRGSGQSAEILFGGLMVLPGSLPRQLRQVRVVELFAASGPPRRFRIESDGGNFELKAGGAQVHQDAAAAFFKAVPRTRVPLATRLTWSMLLSLLRLPGAARLIRLFRG